MEKLRRRRPGRRWCSIDPEGEAVWVGNGERKFEDFKRSSSAALPYYPRKGLLDTGCCSSSKSPSRRHASLRFPGKVLADEAGGRLFIADSNHNRIVVTDFDGKMLEVIGSGSDRPRWMALSILRASIIRKGWRSPASCCTWRTRRIICCGRVDLATKQVTTIAGTGEQGGGFPGPMADGRFGGPPLATALNSPWALWMHDGETCTSPWPGRIRFGRCRSMRR